MSEINVRDLQCENCRKFSHCNNNELVCISKFKQLKAENEELKKKIDYCFEENSSNYDRFCDICVAKDTCNGNCCYNQIKEMLVYEI